jgi:hypothetical protein
MTKRATSVASFVRHDCTKAEVRITLSNVGNGAYKPDVFGDAIIVERIIYSGGGSLHNVKDGSGVLKYSKSKKSYRAGSYLVHSFFAFSQTAKLSPKA